MEPSEHVPEESQGSGSLKVARERRGRHDERAQDLEDRLRSLRDALRAARQGDFSIRLPTGSADGGTMEEIALAFNNLIEENQRLVGELDRIHRVVGTEGKTSARASLGPALGSWALAVGSVNALIEKMAWPTAEARSVLELVAGGDLSRDMLLHMDGTPLQGDFHQLGTTVRAVVTRLRTVSSGVSRIVREMGTEGKLGGQASVEGLSGSWKDLVDDVNLLAGNLTAQVRNIALVSTAIANGDLSQKIVVETRGEILELKMVINATVDQLRSFSAEVIRVAREVGTEGKLGAQADVRGVSGVWQELTGSVNRLAGNLTSQVRNIATIATAIAKGDLSQEITVDAKGEILELKNTINAMLDQLRSFAAEVTRVAKEAGTEGRLGAQADVKGVSGTWKELTDNVNLLAGNLAAQVRSIALVTTAVANGDLSKKVAVEASGEMLELKSTVNTMVDRLQMFAAEVTRVAREVGTEGKLGGQADVKGVSGTWRDLTDNVNLMAGNLTDQVRGIAKVVAAIAAGDLSQKLVVEAKGEIAALADTINSMTDSLRTFAAQVTTVAREVGIDGKLGGQARVPEVSGTWRELTDNVNLLAGNLTNQVRNIALVTTAVANGDLSQKITVAARGEILELKSTINVMVDQLRRFASEVTRIAKEVGTEGKLGAQADMKGVAGTWKDLTDNVNVMASNLTSQVRGIAKVVTAVADGDLTQKLVLEARGEIAALADTINGMTDTLRTFSDQVTTVAREVGMEGKLGGQATVPGAAGTWRALTDNVNQLAANLTSQVRAIFDVATAVIQGDLTRSISVEARGEVLGLKDTINQMIANLRDTTLMNEEQDWLKTNLAKFFGLMQGQRNLKSLTDQVMNDLTPVVGAQHGAFYLAERSGDQVTLALTSSYAYTRRKHLSNRFGLGEGLVGQCALERKPIVVTEVPPDYIRVGSGLGQASPRSIAVYPIFFEGQVQGVIELGSFHEFTAVQLAFLEQLMLSIGLAINLIGSSMRTEHLLQQLQGSNLELDQRRKELEDRAQQLEARNRQIALAGVSLEAKSEELARVSQYKSQFLTNMSHEIRTPLNSMMILAQMLAENGDKNLSSTQEEWAATIYASGRDLLALINQILDLSKVEAGRTESHLEVQPIQAVVEFVERTFRPVALQRGLDFAIEVAPSAPHDVTTDGQLLEQILKNLLANAFKFTEHGRVELSVERVPLGHVFRSVSLQHAPSVIALSVTDTGLGIAPEQQEKIFEAFQQADTSITRKYGGTGLGLAISREYARVLGGEIDVQSELGRGSTFTLYLPCSAREVTGQREAAGAAPRPAALASVALAPISQTDDEENHRALAGRKILVVEDDARNLYAVTSLLERVQASVFPAFNAQEAFARLRSDPDIDLVLMDIMMPDMDGYQATRYIRDMPEFAALPIIALTAKASNADRARCLDSGFSDYLVKPADTRQLMAAIARNLRPMGGA